MRCGLIARTSPRFQLAAAVAQFAEQLRRDPWTQSQRLADVLTVARYVQGQLPFDKDVNEFVVLSDIVHVVVTSEKIHDVGIMKLLCDGIRPTVGVIEYQHDGLQYNSLIE